MALIAGSRAADVDRLVATDRHSRGRDLDGGLQFPPLHDGRCIGDLDLLGISLMVQRH